MQNKTTNIRKLTGTAMLGAVAAVLMYMEFPIPIMPSFVKLDVSELPALLAAYAYGPVSGIAVCLIKNLIKLPSTSTAAVGELFNFVMGALFVGVAGFVYKRSKTRRSALIGAGLGALIMAVVSVPYNYFIVYPAYVVLYHLPLEAIIGMYQAINPSVDGLQVAYAERLGYAMVATSRRAAAAGERRLVTVVVGASSAQARAIETQKLLNWGYSAFDAVRLYAAGQAVSTAPVWKGRASTVALGRTQPIVVTVPRGQAARIQTTLTRQDPLLAPLAQGQTVGTLHIRLGTQPWQTLPLQALEAVPSAGWLGRTWDAIRLGIQ